MMFNAQTHKVQEMTKQTRYKHTKGLQLYIDIRILSINSEGATTGLMVSKEHIHILLIIDPIGPASFYVG